VLEIVTNVVTSADVALHMYSSGFPTLDSMLTGAGGATWNGPITFEGDGDFWIEGGGGGLILSGPSTAIGAYGTIHCVGYDTEIKIQQPLKFDGALDFGSLGLGVLGSVYTTLTLNSPDNSWSASYLKRGRINIGADNALPLVPIYAGTLAGNDHRILIDLAGHNQAIIDIQENFLGNDPITIGNSSTSKGSVLSYAGDPFTPTLTTATIVDTMDTGFQTTALTVSSGMLTLVNTNTYTGPTVVSGGTLLIGSYSDQFGSLNFVGQLGYTPVAVSGGGTLGGNGSILGPVVVDAGGILSPGSSIGTLTINNILTLTTGAHCVFEVDLATHTNDMVSGLSEVKYGGTIEIQNVGSGAFGTGTVLKLFDSASYIDGPVILQPATPGYGLVWDTSMLAVDGTLHVVASATPPSMSGPSRLTDGNFGFTLNGATGQQYSIFGTTNVALPMSSWSLLQSGTLPSSSYLYRDLTATNYLQRYYRTSTP